MVSDYGNLELYGTCSQQHDPLMYYHQGDYNSLTSGSDCIYVIKCIGCPTKLSLLSDHFF